MKLSIFQIPIYIGNIDVDKIKLSNQDFEKTWLSETKSSYNFVNKIDTTSWKYLTDIIVKLLKEDFNFDYKLSLEKIWENKYEKDDFQENHIHIGSHFSFIIYKKVDKSNTIFFRPDKNLFESFYGNNFELFNNEYVPECKSNQIIIFPSCIEHMVCKNNLSETISGNLTIKRV
tara:strand:+ start:268 stop:789 length:522 start_codon:yes stop_codon:yes gene_type:complete